MLKYGPPMTDSDDSDPDDLYDGFSFGDKIKRDYSKTRYVAPDQELYDAITSGNLNKTISELSNLDKNVNDLVLDETTPLHLACRVGSIKIVQYLIENEANVNRQVDSKTPLMEICNFSDKSFVIKDIIQIVKLLLSREAVINVSDKYGMTPFLFACERGHIFILKELLPHVSLESKNNEGKTAIYLAIENNHIEVVKFLLESGINCNIVDNRGYTPKQVADSYGFHDISELLPAENISFILPATFLTYNSIRDHIPRIFLKSEVPEYFQEVYEILNEIKMEKYAEFLAKSNINLADFLTLTDSKMKDIGISYSYQRNRMRLGILYFHLHHWSKKSIARVKRKETENFYEILMLSANHLLNLVIIGAAIKFIGQNIKEPCFGTISKKEITKCKDTIIKYKFILKQLTSTAKYLNSFSPDKSPTYIDYDEYMIEKKKTNKIKCCVKYSLLIGVSVLFCIKVKSFGFI